MGDDWRRLGTLIARRRRALGMRTQPALAQASGLSRSTVQKLEWGTASPERKTLRMLEEALRWQEGSTTTVLAGGDPTEIPDDADIESAYRREPLSEGDMSALIRNVVFEAAISLAPDTPASRIREVEERILEMTRRTGFGPPRRRQDTHTQDDPET